MTAKDASDSAVASKNITKRIAELGDWRGKTLARLRQLIHEADPEIEEEWKWRGTPVWAHDGGVCTGESYKEVVKLTFFRGAALPDPQRLFNSSLEGNTRRAIDIREGEKFNETAFKKLIQTAVAANSAARAPRAGAKSAAAKKGPAAKGAGAKGAAAKSPAGKGAGAKSAAAKSPSAKGAGVKSAAAKSLAAKGAAKKSPAAKKK